MRDGQSTRPSSSICRVIDKGHDRGNLKKKAITTKDVKKETDKLKLEEVEAAKKTDCINSGCISCTDHEN